MRFMKNKTVQKYNNNNKKINLPFTFISIHTAFYLKL